MQNQDKPTLKLPIKSIFYIFLLIGGIQLISQLDRLIRCNFISIRNVNQCTLYGQTTWEWLKLLIGPLIAITGGFILNGYFKNRDERRLDKAKETELDQLRHETLITYFNEISNLLLNKNWPKYGRNTNIEENPNLTIVALAKARTSSVLNEINGKRKGSLLLFLLESKVWQIITDIDGNSSWANLSFCDLNKANLTRINLSGANLSEANLNLCNLSEAELSNTIMINTKLTSVDLKKSNLSGAKLIKANLRRANLSDAVLENANFKEAKLTGGILLSEGKVKFFLFYFSLRFYSLLVRTYPFRISKYATYKSDKIRVYINYLFGANLKGANLKEAYLRHVSLLGANLDRADLESANLSQANLSFANLRGASLIEADLKGASLIGADLKGADLKGADLKGADLKGADLKGANLCDKNIIKPIKITTGQIKKTFNWETALYKEDFRKKLGLPPTPSSNPPKEESE
ncbi:pentapeptide repeat-containing protein [Acaryochloris marina]|uniref:Pentapeptide repeat protein n=1 Tax=Acaryochloris marina (strain MBIC 11017) TaxID=329726 RepID=A8ZPM5_ACAM1|nr:pentapeptide repeat-containing protein [Acaryochloris marina]ABW32961.1 pentapeptide repeat protein [Acaryochloris marina MBIC11017]